MDGTAKSDAVPRAALPDADSPPRARETPPMPGRAQADPLILAALAAGKTQMQAAEIAGVSSATVARRLREPGFSRKLHDLRNDLIDRTADALAAGTTEAGNTLRAVMQDPMARPGERAAAAKTLLDSTLKFQEQSVLLRRLRALEDGIDREPKEASS